MPKKPRRPGFGLNKKENKKENKEKSSETISDGKKKLISLTHLYIERKVFKINHKTV